LGDFRVCRPNSRDFTSDFMDFSDFTQNSIYFKSDFKDCRYFREHMDFKDSRPDIGDLRLDTRTFHIKQNGLNYNSAVLTCNLLIPQAGWRVIRACLKRKLTPHKGFNYHPKMGLFYENV